jgi:hypothetical protein
VWEGDFRVWNKSIWKSQIRTHCASSYSWQQAFPSVWHSFTMSILVESQAILNAIQPAYNSMEIHRKDLQLACWFVGYHDSLWFQS